MPTSRIHYSSDIEAFIEATLLVEANDDGQYGLPVSQNSMCRHGPPVVDINVDEARLELPDELHDRILGNSVAFISNKLGIELEPEEVENLREILFDVTGCSFISELREEDIF